MRDPARSLLALCLAVLPACANVATVPVLGAGPGRAGDPSILDDAIRGAQQAGYQPLRIDADRGRFVLISRADRSGLTRFEVQCFAEGWISIVPTDGTVERDEEHIRAPAGVRAEYLRLAAEISRVIAVRP